MAKKAKLPEGQIILNNHTPPGIIFTIVDSEYLGKFVMHSYSDFWYIPVYSLKPDGELGQFMGLPKGIIIQQCGTYEGSLYADS